MCKEISNINNLCHPTGETFTIQKASQHLSDSRQNIFTSKGNIRKHRTEQHGITQRLDSLSPRL